MSIRKDHETEYTELKRSALLDLTRAIAISLVLAVHVGQTFDHPIGDILGHDFYGISLGRFGVTIFLILSGITLELQYGHKTITYTRLLVERIVRIYPVYWLVLLVGIMVYLVRSSIGDSLPPFEDQIGVLLVNITGFIYFDGTWYGPFSVPSFFILLIMCMYLLYPMISKSIERSPHITLLIMLIITIISRVFLAQYEFKPSLLSWFATCRVFEFALGVYLAVQVRRDFWLCINGIRKLDNTLAVIGGISFPLFLVHTVLLPVLTSYSLFGIDQRIVIIIYLISSFIISWIILIIVKLVVPRVYNIDDYGITDL